jgi:hypothetical protein
MEGSLSSSSILFEQVYVHIKSGLKSQAYGTVPSVMKLR